MTGDALRFVSSLSLGVLAGALSLEGLVLVPHWRSLAIGPFSELHRDFAPRLYTFFAPLTTIAVGLSISSGAVSALGGDRTADDGFTIASAVLATSLLAFYGLYFHAANNRLPELAKLRDERGLTLELVRWHRVHAARTVTCVLAVVLAMLGLSR